MEGGGPQKDAGGTGATAWILGGLVFLAGVVGVIGTVILAIDRISSALETVDGAGLLEAALWILVAALVITAFAAVTAFGRKLIVAGARGETTATPPPSQFERDAEGNPRRPG